MRSVLLPPVPEVWMYRLLVMHHVLQVGMTPWSIIARSWALVTDVVVVAIGTGFVVNGVDLVAPSSGCSCLLGLQLVPDLFPVAQLTVPVSAVPVLVMQRMPLLRLGLTIPVVESPISISSGLPLASLNQAVLLDHAYANF
ncbi:hypothetical protein Tco_1075715 [Tanacetum coccineum]